MVSAAGDRSKPSCRAIWLPKRVPLPEVNHSLGWPGIAEFHLDLRDTADVRESHIKPEGEVGTIVLGQAVKVGKERAEFLGIDEKAEHLLGIRRGGEFTGEWNTHSFVSGLRSDIDIFSCDRLEQSGRR